MQIKKGTTRIVFLIGRYAIKFPRIHHKYPGHRYKMFLRGLLANIDENFWWKSAYKRDKLCPIKFKSPLGFFLVMDRAIPLKNLNIIKSSLKKIFLVYH